MDLATAITLGVTVTLALAGYALTYRNNLRIDQRKARLDRVNRQLGELYGPLLALSAAGAMAWLQFRSAYRPGLQPFWGTEPPTEDEAAAYRLWMKEVFMPLNLRMEAAVIEKADLLEELEMPPVLLALCAHVAAYKATLKRWELGESSEDRGLVNFPTGLHEYAAGEFARLKRTQNELLGLLQAPSASSQAA